MTTALESAAVQPAPAEAEEVAQADVASGTPAPGTQAADAGTQVAAAAALPVVQPAGYAGSTPSRVNTVFAPDGRFGPETVAARSPELDALIARYAQHYEVPEDLVRRVVKRESTFNPGARNGPYWGLMQIRHDTARGMGYDGPASGLLDAETNLKYAVRYLRGAYLTAGGNHDQAVRFYARGYYYDAKARGLLHETGLRGPRKRMPEVATAAAQPRIEVAKPVAAAAQAPAETALQSQAEPVAAVQARSARRALIGVAPPSEPQAGN